MLYIGSHYIYVCVCMYMYMYRYTYMYVDNIGKINSIYQYYWTVVDWCGYHRISPVDNLPWRCSWRHGTSQPVPATLTRRLRHINDTATAGPRQLSKIHLPCRWSGGFQLSMVVIFQRSWYHVLLVRLSGSVSSNLAVLLLSTHNPVTSLAHELMNTEPCSHHRTLTTLCPVTHTYVPV